jgi:hypothetical protein
LASNKDTFDPIAVLAKQIGARLRVLPGLHRSELGLVFTEDDGLDVKRLKERDEIAPSFCNQLIGEEVAIAEDYCQCMRCHDPIRSVLIRVLPWPYFFRVNPCSSVALLFPC